MDDVTALRDALLDDLGPRGEFYPMRQRHVVQARLDALIAAVEAAAARRAIEGSGVVEALMLDALVEIRDLLSLRNAPTGEHVVQAWNVAVRAIAAALPRPEEPRVDEGHEQRRSNAWRSINGLTPDARP